MILNLPGLIYSLVMILAANYEARRPNTLPLTALLSLGLTQIKPLWQAVEALIPRINPLDQPTFDRRSPVHRVACLLLIAVMTVSVWQALSIRDDSLNTFFASDIRGLLLSMTAMALIYVSLSALGAGWQLRRDHREVLQRLGLSLPTVRDCIAGLISGCLIFAGMIFVTFFVVSTASTGHFGAELDGSRQLFEVVKESLPAALIVALLAGIGEEILFRGALQPVFGILVSSLAFTLVHVQYVMSPATLILFLVSIGMGLVRKRFSTTAAIVAHASYDLMPFLLYRMLTV